MDIPRTYDEAQRFLKSYKMHGSSYEMANYSNKSPSTLRKHKRRAEKIIKENNQDNKINFPEFPDNSIDIEDTISHLAKRSREKIAKRKALRWQEIKINTKLPVGLVSVGDPHMDDPGCDWSALKRDSDICRENDGIFCINMGDLHNNWVGRLQALYKKHELSADQGWDLIEWFLHESGFNWLVHIFGNHDVWNEGARLLKLMNADRVPMIDWRAQFQIRFSNDFVYKIDAAHDHKGHSQYNKVHGNKKAALMSSDTADAYISAHKHCYAYSEEMVGGRTISFLRVAGYKKIDEYADRIGFEPNFEDPASTMLIVDPVKKTVQHYRDLEEGADILKYKRGKK